MDNFVVEHWRDGECINRITVENRELRANVRVPAIGEEMSRATINCDEYGNVSVVFAPGSLTLATGDELRFNIYHLQQRNSDGCFNRR